MKTAILLMDINNYYCSAERVFDASLRSKPVAVLSNNDGCVISRSEETKSAGVSMGAPLFKVRGLLDSIGAEIMSSNYSLYGDLSARTMSLISDFTPAVEIYSIDEAFLEIDQSSKSFDYVAREIKDRVYQGLGLPVCVGVGATKTLAKIANRIAKKSEKSKGVVDLFESPYIDQALKRTLVENVWGVGPSYSRKLQAEGVTTALHLRDVDLRWARKQLSVMGARVVMELRGIRSFPLELDPPPRHSITSSQTFGSSVTEQRDLREAVSSFLHRAGAKLRKNNLAAHSVTVLISSDRFNPDPGYYSNSATYNSTFLSDANIELQAWAFACLGKIFRPGVSYRKAGVILSGLAPADKLTARMFDETRWERFRKIQQAVDQINLRWGRDTIRLGVISREPRWQMKAARRSPRYTTRLDEIMRVK